MARKNPRHRRAATQKALLRSIVQEHGPSHDDSFLLQRGKVRSAMTRPAHVKGRGNVAGILAKDQKGVRPPREFDGMSSTRPVLTRVQSRPLTVNFEQEIALGKVGVSDPRSLRAPKPKD